MCNPIPYWKKGSEGNTQYSFDFSSQCGLINQSTRRGIIGNALTFECHQAMIASGHHPYHHHDHHQSSRWWLAVCRLMMIKGPSNVPTWTLSSSFFFDFTSFATSSLSLITNEAIDHAAWREWDFRNLRGGTFFLSPIVRLHHEGGEEGSHLALWWWWDWYDNSWQLATGIPLQPTSFFLWCSMCLSFTRSLSLSLFLSVQPQHPYRAGLSSSFLLLFFLSPRKKPIGKKVRINCSIANCIECHFKDPKDLVFK